MLMAQDVLEPSVEMKKMKKERKKTMGGVVRHMSGSFRLAGSRIGDMVSGEKGKKREGVDIVMKTPNKSHLYVADEGGSGEKKKMNVAHWGETKLAPPVGYDRRKDPHQEEKLAQEKRDKEELEEKKRKKKGKGKIIVKGEDKYGHGDIALKPKPVQFDGGGGKKKKGVLASISKGMTQRFGGKDTLNREEQQKNNVRTLGSFVVTAACLVGILISL